MVGVVLAIAHASRGKEVYYFIIMLCKIKNEMCGVLFFVLNFFFLLMECSN